MSHMSDQGPPTERRPRTPLHRPGDATEPGGRPRRGPAPRFLLVVLVLLILNYITVSLLAPAQEESVRVPYSPYFLQQVEDGNVERIAAQGTTVEGRFKREVRYPPNDSDAEPTRAFMTDVPTFADTEQLSQAHEDNGVVIEAEPLNDGRGVLLSILLGFGPVLLLVGLVVYFARRASG